MRDFIGAAASLYAAVWGFSAMAAWFAKLRLAATIRAELRPLYLPAVVVAYWLSSAPIGWRLIVLACNVASYWLYPDDDDDDRWKRRRKKLVEKIARRGSRLVVATVGAR